MGQRLNSFAVQLVDLAHVVEDRRQLAGQVRDLIIGQMQAAELGHVSDLLLGDLGRHAGKDIRVTVSFVHG